MSENRMVMTVREVQEELRIGRNKAYRLFKQPSFPSFMLDGTYLVARKDFEIWLDRLKKIPGKQYISVCLRTKNCSVLKTRLLMDIENNINQEVEMTY